MIRWKLSATAALVVALVAFAALGGGLRWGFRAPPPTYGDTTATVVGNPS